MGGDGGSAPALTPPSMPPPIPEVTALLTYLNRQRGHVLGILEGLSEDALRRPALPSGWSCLGLVHHLALDVERFWFRAVVAGEREVIDGLDGDGWRVPATMPAAAVFDLYRREIDRANAIITSTPLDTPPAWWPPDLIGDERIPDLRHVVLHTTTETAGHTGHLDAARELMDGKLWLVLTG